jgi:carbon-monoxide dehydrogenase iron sulfur subunit
MELQQLFQRHQLNLDELDPYVSQFELVYLRNGEVVYREGDASQFFYFLGTGQVVLAKKNRRGQEKPIQRLNGGEYFGDVEILQNTTRIVSVRAVEDTSLYRMSGDLFFTLLHECPSFRLFIEKVVQFRLLKRVSLFKDSDDSVIRIIQQLLLKKEYKEGDIIFIENDVPQGLYIVTEGLVCIDRKNNIGQKDTLEIVRGGDSFNELALMSSQKQTVSATSIKDTTVLLLPRGRFQQLLEERIDLVSTLLVGLNLRLRKIVSKMEKVNSSSLFHGMTIISRSDRCLSCRTCELACALANSKSSNLFLAVGETPSPIRRIHVRKVINGSAETLIRPEHCMHCRDAPCLDNCRRGAIRRDPVSHFIEIKVDICIGCGRCAKACPYEVITITQSEGKKRMALKCNYCSEHRSGPACVRSCPTNALVIALPTMIDQDNLGDGEDSIQFVWQKE